MDREKNELVDTIRGLATIDDNFERITSYFMNNLSLVVSNREYRLTELEVYYYDEDKHPDPYVHRSPEQLSVGKWYFNGSGLDITIGDADREIYGGILIRGIVEIGEKPRYISGPSNVLKEIFSVMGNITDGQSGICLRELKPEILKVIEIKPIRCARVGLKKKENDTGNFAEKSYRYIVDLNFQHKFKDKEKVIRQLLTDGKIKTEQANEIMGYNVKL